MNQNNNVRQITPEEIAQAEGLPKPLTQEELQKTQILNLSELQKTIKFEKLTSKKPAIIIAVIGVLLLTFGATFQIVMSMNKTPNKIEKRVVEPNKPVETSMSCVKTTLNNPDGTDIVYNIDYYFENDKISSSIKKFQLTATANNPMGEPTIKSNLDVYKKLVVSTNGYQVSTNQTNTKDLTVTIQVDYHSLDLTTIPQENQTNGLTKIDYKRDTNSETIKQNMLKQGFTCE